MSGDVRLLKEPEARNLNVPRILGGACHLGKKSLSDGFDHRQGVLRWSDCDACLVNICEVAA